MCACTDWDEFEGTCDQRPVLGGNGSIEDNLLHLPGGDYRAVALRSFDPESGKWAIWWLDARSPHSLDVPVIGRFEGGVGHFFAHDRHEGRPVELRFIWSGTDTDTPQWEQAFSEDGGGSWETNWVMRFERR